MEAAGAAHSGLDTWDGVPGVDFELSGVSMLERSDVGISAGAAQGASVEQGVMVVIGACLGVLGGGVAVAKSAAVVLSVLCSLLLLLSLKTTAAASAHVGTRRRAITCSSWRASAGVKETLFLCIKKREASSTVPWWMM